MKQASWDFVCWYEDFLHNVGEYQCSNCHTKRPDNGPSEYCPGCGALMAARSRKRHVRIPLKWRVCRNRATTLRATSNDNELACLLMDAFAAVCQKGISRENMLKWLQEEEDDG